MLSATPANHSAAMKAFHFQSARITDRADNAELITCTGRTLMLPYTPC